MAENNPKKMAENNPKKWLKNPPKNDWKNDWKNSWKNGWKVSRLMAKWVADLAEFYYSNWLKFQSFNGWIQSSIWLKFNKISAEISQISAENQPLFSRHNGWNSAT